MVETLGPGVTEEKADGTLLIVSMPNRSPPWTARLTVKDGWPFAGIDWTLDCRTILN
jgi:hypothetical protein